MKKIISFLVATILVFGMQPISAEASELREEDVKSSLSTRAYVAPPNLSGFKKYSEIGTAKTLYRAGIFASPYFVPEFQLDTYSKGQTFYYDTVYMNNAGTEVWVSYTSVSNRRVYVISRSRSKSTDPWVKYLHCT